MPRLTQVAGIGKGPSVAAFVTPTMVFGDDTTTGPINEGGNIQIQILTTGIPDGGSIQYNRDGGTATASDFSISSLSGTMTVNSDKALLNFTVNEDLTTEGSEELRLKFEYDYVDPTLGNRTLTLGTLAITITDSSTTPSVPTYILNRSSEFANEGTNFTITLVTANVSAGTTVPYTITGVSSADIGGVSLTGSFVTGTTDDVTFNVTADATTENQETFNLALDNGEDSITVTINDTSLDPTYAVNASRASVNEGESFTVNLTTTDVQDGVGLAYTITGVSSADIEGASLTGSFTVNNNAASLTVNTSEDVTLGEGEETFTLSLDNGADDVSVTIADTSVDTTPTYTNFSLQSATSVNEGGASTFRITGRNIAQNTTIDVNLVGVTGTIAANDFAPASLTRTVTWTGASNPITQSQDFTITLSEDEITEGAESFKCVLASTDSNGTSTGDLESATITIGDTSLTPVTGQAEYSGLTTGNRVTTFTVPEGVTSISMLCIGGGGGGGGCSNIYAGGGGGGGGLSYANNVSVTPGETLNIQAGGAGAAGSRDGNGGAGGTSSISRGATALCSVDGGGAGTSSNTGGTGGGSTGVGTRYSGGAGGTGQTYSRGGGGGGAAGYSGNGGNGQNGSSSFAGGNGAGGGGGGAGSVSTTQPGQSGGGGVGNKGQGSNGVGGNLYQDGGGGSAGESGQDGIGGAFGGGGSGTYRTGNPAQGSGQRGGVGSVRLMWPGTSRQYPTTRTANENVVTGTYDTLVANKTTADEDPYTNATQTITFTLTTSDVPEGTTVGYTFANIQGTVTASDFINRDTMFTIGSDGTATVSMQPTGDFATEGTEIFRLQLAATDSVGFDTDDLQSQNVSIVDDYPATVYNGISLDKTNYNEGETVTITVDYTNNTDKSVQVAYTASTSAGNQTDDLNYTYGTLTLVDGNTYEGSPYNGNKIVISQDLTTEGAETLTIRLNDEDINGNPTNNRSATATINDTSLTPRVPGQSLDGYIQKPNYDDQVGGARPSAGWGSVLGGDDDFVVVGSYLSPRPSSAGSYEAAHGQVYIYNRQTKALLHIIENPLTGSTYESERKIMFGAGVGLSKVGSTYYLAVAGDNFKYNGVSYYDPRIFVYKSTNNWSTYSLHKTARLGTADTGNPNTQSEKRFRVGGDYLVYGYNNMSNSGTVRFLQLSSNGTSDLSTPVSQWESMASNTLQQYQNWEAGSTADTDGTYILYGSYERDAVQGPNTYQNAGAANINFISNGNQYRSQLGTSYAGSSSNYTNFEFGKGVALAGNYYAVASGGDDYSGNTDAGRVRTFLISSGATRGTINRPVFSEGISGGGGSKFYGGQLVGNSDGYIAVLWQDIYGSDNNTLRIYDASNGSQVNIVPHPGNVLYSTNLYKNLYHYDCIHLTDSYVFTRTTALNTDGGAAYVRIYIH